MWAGCYLIINTFCSLVFRERISTRRMHVVCIKKVGQLNANEKPKNSFSHVFRIFLLRHDLELFMWTELKRIKFCKILKIFVKSDILLKFCRIENLIWKLFSNSLIWLVRNLKKYRAMRCLIFFSILMFVSNNLTQSQVTLHLKIVISTELQQIKN